MECLPERYTGNGLVDLQFNGYAGYDLNGDELKIDMAVLRAIRVAMWRRGIVMALPTLITDDPLRMISRVKRYAGLIADDKDLADFFPRFHVEGPFVSPKTGPRGAHPKQFCAKPKKLPELIQRLFAVSNGRVGIVTLAPDLPGVVDMIKICIKMGICVALGHHNASKGQIDRAIGAGAKLATHLGNGSHARLPRLDNYIQYQLGDDRLFASFIADGHHMPFSTLKNFLRAKKPCHSILITDAVTAAEQPAGKYRFGPLEVEREASGKMCLPGTPYLAGSTLTLDMAVINVALHCGFTFETAWQMTSKNPAKLLGLPLTETVTVSVSETQGFSRL